MKVLYMGEVMAPMAAAELLGRIRSKFELSNPATYVFRALVTRRQLRRYAHIYTYSGQCETPSLAHIQEDSVDNCATINQTTLILTEREAERVKKHVLGSILRINDWSYELMGAGYNNYFTWDLRQSSEWRKFALQHVQQDKPSLVNILTGWTEKLSLPYLLRVQRTSREVHISAHPDCPSRISSFLLACCMVAACSGTRATEPITKWEDEVCDIYKNWLLRLNDRIIKSLINDAEATTAHDIFSEFVNILGIMADLIKRSRTDQESPVAAQARLLAESIIDIINDYKSDKCDNLEVILGQVNTAYRNAHSDYTDKTDDTSCDDPKDP